LRCYFSRRTIISNCLFGHTCRFVVRSQPSADTLHVRRVQFLQCAGYTPVQGSPAYGTQFRVSHLAQEVVGVVVSSDLLISGNFR
jgi:hypothetical protein